MAEPSASGGRDLVLAPGCYAYVQADNSGSIKTNVGPTVVTLSGQDRPVRYSPKSRTFESCGQHEAVCPNIWAGEGDYIILENPSTNSSHPEEGGARVIPQGGLDMGKRVVIPGPCTFALWPGQSAKTLPGHHLLSNQYLLVRVYNESAARENWARGVQTVKEETVKEETPAEEKVVIRKSSSLSVVNPTELKLGQLLIIPGNEVSFYIPPTGIEVVADANGEYVRDAITLERLEYCILVDEDGEKRYERGPAVVFPEPTERFIKDTDGRRKFKAIELTNMAGLHIKVIADYRDEEGKNHKAGEELFITGVDQAIYYPRIEHSIIKYGDREKHYAVAVPRGEGRYVMDRNTGVIDTTRGPIMLLPDPRDHVIVRRILSDKEVALWYPGNTEALRYNQELARSAAEEQEKRGFVSDEGYRRRSKRTNVLARYAAAAERDLDEEEVGADALMADEFSRGVSFTPPRTVTLDTKYDGVPVINVWTGYAVQVINREGKRRVIEGPASILLDYDENLEILELSTGKPKNTDTLQRTVYLRTKNNKVSDIVDVETSDHVRAKVKLSLLVNFEGDSEKWFQVENYVKLLCDHIRSILKGKVKKVTVEEFYAKHVEFIRDVLLGTPVEGERKGMRFEENGMTVRDVEILGFSIEDPQIAKLLDQAQFDAVRSNIDIENARRELADRQHREEIARQIEVARVETELHKVKLQLDLLAKSAELTTAQFGAAITKAQEESKVNHAVESAKDVLHNAALSRQKAEVEQRLGELKVQQEIEADRLRTEVEAVVKRFEAAKGSFSDALVALNRDDVLVKVAKAASVQAMIGGTSIADVIHRIFKGTPLADIGRLLGEDLEETETAIVDQ